MTTQRPTAKASGRAVKSAEEQAGSMPERRPQAQRSAETRAKLIEAAISCLHRAGYSATAATMVANEAKVSRGAMSHQYPTKTDLMLAVVQAVYEQDAEHYRRTIASTPPAQWLVDLPSTMWDVISKPSGTAVMEIMLASRSDPDLAGKLCAMQNAIDIRAHHWIEQRIVDIGLKDRPDGEAIHRLFVSAVRGISLEALFRRDPEGVKNSVALLGEIIQLLYPALKKKLPKSRK
ncbi:MAG: helix-turn-helix domain-containing protein [Rhodanobacter sp.]